MRVPPTWLLVAALVLGAGAASAQGTGRYAFTRYGIEHGLPSDRVLAVAQDSLGFIWIGTSDGVARFDGVRTRIWRHRPGSTTGLPSSLIAAVHVDHAGTVWVGTERGLARYDRQARRFERFATEALADAAELPVAHLQSDPDGLWVSGLATVSRVRADGTVASLPVPGRLYAPRAGETWLGVGPCRLRDLPFRCDAVDVGVRTATADLVQVWADGAQTHLARSNGEVWSLLPELRRIGEWPALRDLPRFGVAAYAPPHLWVGTSDGLYAYHTGRGDLLRVGPREGLLSHDIRALTVDRQGGVWIGTDRGLYRWSRPDPAFRAVTAENGLPDGRVNGLHPARDGSVWVGTNGGLFQRTPDGRWRTFFAGESAYRNGIWQVAPAAGGGLWVGGKGSGLRRLDPETGRWRQELGLERAFGAERPVEGTLPVRHVQDTGGRLWVGSTAGFAVRERSGRWRAFREGDGGRDGLPASATNVVHVGDDGRVWLGTDKGLAEYLPPVRGFRRVATGSLGAPIVWDVTASDADPGALWVGTIGTGACRVTPETDRATCVTTAEGLPSNSVHRIESGAGALWLGTDRGVARLDPATLAVETYTAADGLHDDVVDLMSSARGPDGKLYFGGPGGFTSFIPAAVARRTQAPPVQFTSVTTAGLPHPAASPGDTLRLARGGRRFVAEFATLDYAAPSRNRYRYRLLPLESEWTTVDARSAEARYAALPPGTYVLEVSGSGPTGGFRAESSRLHVIARPVWWERTGVQLLGLALVLAGVGAVGWAGVRRSERRRREAVEVAQRLAAGRDAERLRLARELHDGAMQHLYRTGHDLDRLAEAAGADAIAPVRAGLDEAAGELRAVLSDIRPPHVGTLGAAAAVRAVAGRFASAYPDVHIDVAAGTTGRRWPVPVQHAAVRIVQESLSNAGRHAAADRVCVRLDEADGYAVVAVSDDGRGFDTTVPDVDHVRASHYGLAGLRERAEGLSGHVEVASAPGAGTAVRAWLPLSDLTARAPWLSAPPPSRCPSD